MSTTRIPLTDQLACARRELALRRRVYATWVARGRMEQSLASHEIACMEAIARTLALLVLQEQPQLALPGTLTKGNDGGLA